MLDFCIDKRSIVQSGFLFVLLVSGWGLSKLTIDPNNRAFFSSQHPKYAELLKLESTFGSNTELVYVLSALGGLEQAPEFVRAIEWMTEHAWSIAGVRSVDSLATYPYITTLEDELVISNALEYACTHSVCDPGRVQQILPKHLVNRLISADHESAAVVAKVDLSDYSDQGVLDIASQAGDLKEEFKSQFRDIDVYLTGGVPMMEAFYTAAKRDSAILMPIALLVMFLVMAVFLGSLLQSLFLSLIGLASVSITIGLAGWFGHTLNTATATAPLVIFILVVAGAMHLFVHVSGPVPSSDADETIRRARAAARSNLVPIVLTSLTTAIGFASMISVSAPPIRQLGVLAAIGVVIGAIISLVVMPGVFASFPRIAASTKKIELQSALNRYARWLESARPNPLLVGTFLVFCVVGLLRVSFDEDFVRYFSEDSTFRSDTEHISKILAGPYHLDLVYDSGESAGIYSSAAINDVNTVAEYFEADPRVVNVFSVVDVLEAVSKAFSPSELRDEASPEQLAQYFLTYELSLDRGQSTLDFVDADHRFARTSILLGDVTMGEIRALVEGAEGWIKLHLPHASVIITGEGVPTAYLSGESIAEMSWGIVSSMILSSLIVAAFLRKPAAALIIFLATVAPLVAGFGIWGWFGGEIGMAATLVIATTIGVVVDDTIHLAYRYLEGRAVHDLTPWGAAAFSVHKTGTALVGTSVALALGFSVLAFSEFRMNSTFGICSSLVIVLALAYNLTVSPRLLRAIV